MDEKDIKSVLLASLLHDLGQYPLAHEIEEFVRELGHKSMTLKFLDNPTKDRYGHTLRDIIEDEGWGWGVKSDDVKKILKGVKEHDMFPCDRALKTKLLSSIIDSPIDVDKLDYLLRDSQNCYLKYGELIDVDRLIRTLTVIITKDNHGHKTFTIGTYEKGQTAAESLTFARYLLYQSVYWHHTSRAVRVMLKEALESVLKKKMAKNKTFIQEFEELLGSTKEPKNIMIYDLFNLIEKWTDDTGKELIQMVKNRDYYKRILTIHSYSNILQEKGMKSLLDQFRQTYNKIGFQDKLQKKILERFENYIFHTQHLPKVSVLARDRTNKVIEILSTPKKIFCDCPEPTYGTLEKLKFIPEPKRLQKNYFIRSKVGERISEVWNEVHFNLMNIAAKGRVFCYPEIRDTLMTALGPDGIKECLESVISESTH